MTPLNIILIAFGSVFVEEISLVIPSTAVFVAVGSFWASLNIHSFLSFFILIVVPMALGVALGSYPIFLIVKYYRDALEKKPNFFSKYFRHAKVICEKNTKKIDVFYFIIRALPSFSGLMATLIGGLLGLKSLQYLSITFLASIIRVGTLSFVGWQANNLFVYFTGIYGWVGILLSVILTLLIFRLVFFR